MTGLWLKDAQLKVLSEIGTVIGQLSAASMILPFIFEGLDRAKLPMIFLGLFITLGSWLFSIIVVKKVRK